MIKGSKIDNNVKYHIEYNKFEGFSLIIKNYYPMENTN